MSYPTDLTDLDTTRGTDGQTLAVPNHATHHANEDAVIEALQTKVGIDSSADTDSIDYKLKNASSINPGHKHTLLAGISDVAITTPTDGNGLFYDEASSSWKNSSTSVADSSTTVKGVTKMSVAPADSALPIAVGTNDGRVPTQDENDALAGTSGTPSGTNKYVTNDDTATVSTANKLIRATAGGKIPGSFLDVGFGGNGSDGALAITTGTRTIDLGGEPIVTKNYTSISITGDGVLAFSNPHANGSIVNLKSQGDVILTSSATPMIDMRLMGAIYGAGGATSQATGAIGSSGFTTTAASINAGNLASAGNSAGAATSSAGTILWTPLQLPGKTLRVFTGAGGGGGSAALGTGNFAGGRGGRGGGGIYIECGGALNFTTASGINVSGENGVAGTGPSTTNGNGGGGGGGGAGGSCVILYNTLTAKTGTVIVAGGTGGVGGNNTGCTSPSGNTGGAGGNGSSGSGIGTAGTNSLGNSLDGGGGGGGGGSDSGMTNGGAAVAPVCSGGSIGVKGGPGGGGASGYSLVELNTFF